MGTVFLFLGILVFLNLVAGKLSFVKIDLTQEKIHELSPGTEKILKELDDVVSVKFFLSENLPPKLLPLKDKLGLLLEQFVEGSGGKMRLVRLDPGSSEEAKKEAERYQISPLQFSDIEQDEVKLTSAYFGLVITHRDRQEIIPVATEVENLEYLLAAALKKINREKVPTVALATGHGELDSTQTQYLDRFLRQNYNLQRLDLSQAENPEKSDFEVLVFLGGEGFKEEDLKKIDRIGMAGKGMIFLNSQIKVDNSLSGRRQESGLESWWEHVGMKVKTGAVADEAATMANFQTEQGSFFMPYPYWIQILPENVNWAIPSLGRSGGQILAWASPLEIAEGVEWIIKSSQASWIEEGLSFAPDNISAPQETGQEIVAALKMGEVGAFFEDTVPNKTQGAKIALLTGAENLVVDGQVANSPQNLGLVLNLVDYLASEEDLLQIRSKEILARPLSPTSTPERRLIRIANLLVPLFLIAGIWGLVWFKRSKWHEKHGF